jgi:hypothetical protein
MPAPLTLLTFQLLVRFDNVDASPTMWPGVVDNFGFAIGLP